MFDWVFCYIIPVSVWLGFRLWYPTWGQLPRFGTVGCLRHHSLIFPCPSAIRACCYQSSHTRPFDRTPPLPLPSLHLFPIQLNVVVRPPHTINQSFLSQFVFLKSSLNVCFKPPSLPSLLSFRYVLLFGGLGYGGWGFFIIFFFFFAINSGLRRQILKGKGEGRKKVPRPSYSVPVGRRRWGGLVVGQKSVLVLLVLCALT